MKNKVLGVIGALLFIAAVVVSQFANFAAADVVSIALAAFGLVAAIVSVVKNQKSAGVFGWKSILIIILAVVSGALVCLGGLSSNVFEQISGLVIALIAIILGVVSSVKKE